MQRWHGFGDESLGDPRYGFLGFINKLKVLRIKKNYLDNNLLQLRQRVIILPDTDLTQKDYKEMIHTSTKYDLGIVTF